MLGHVFFVAEVKYNEEKYKFYIRSIKVVKEIPAYFVSTRILQLKNVETGLQLILKSNFPYSLNMNKPF